MPAAALPAGMKKAKGEAPAKPAAALALPPARPASPAAEAVPGRAPASPVPARPCRC